MQGCATMLGVVGQQCYVRLHGALVFFQKQKKQKAKDVFSVSGTGRSEGKI